MEKIYNKLVRDKIPEIILKDNAKPITHIASNDEFLIKLYDKLIEEFNEFKQEPNQEEMGDILEVIESIIEHYRFDRDEIEKIRLNKKSTRGGFDKKIILDKVIKD